MYLCVCVVCVCVGTAISRTRLGRSSRRRAAGCGNDGGVRALEREKVNEWASEEAAAVWRIYYTYIYTNIICTRSGGPCAAADVCETVGPEILICAPPPYDERTRSSYTAGGLYPLVNTTAAVTAVVQMTTVFFRSDCYGQPKSTEVATTTTTKSTRMSTTLLSYSSVSVIYYRVVSSTRTSEYLTDNTTLRFVPFFFFHAHAHTHTRARIYIRTRAMASRLVCVLLVVVVRRRRPLYPVIDVNSILKKPIISDKSTLGFYY